MGGLNCTGTGTVVCTEGLGPCDVKCTCRTEFYTTGEKQTRCEPKFCTGCDGGMVSFKGEGIVTCNRGGGGDELKCKELPWDPPGGTTKGITTDGGTTKYTDGIYLFPLK